MTIDDKFNGFMFREVDYYSVWCIVIKICKYILTRLIFLVVCVAGVAAKSIDCNDLVIT